MALRVIGAGLGRTGTASLKFALERLLGAPCYHMIEVFKHPEHVPVWTRAARGENVDWAALFEGYAASVDWPAAAYWSELAHAFPEALVLLSLRDPEAWWASAQETIFHGSVESIPFVTPEWKEMMGTMFRNRWGADFTDREATLAAFNAHNARVRREIPAHRLLVWKAGDGWEPICNALHCPVPSEPFPRANTRQDWKDRMAAVAEGGSLVLP